MNIEELILEKRYEEIFFSSDNNVKLKFTDVFCENYVKNDKNGRNRIIKFIQKTLNRSEVVKCCMLIVKVSANIKPISVDFIITILKKIINYIFGVF